MAENDDKLKDLKSRLGLVSAGGKKPVAEAKPPASESKSAPEKTREVASPVSSEGSSPAPMAAPTREMSAD